MFPSNEAETIDLYQATQRRWRIVHLQTAFPDAIIENDRGQRLVVEFEHLARNFARHGHDPDGCDLVVCWRNDWPDAPLPVWALDESVAREAALVSKRIEKEIWRWRAEAEKLQILRDKIALLRQRLEGVRMKAEAKIGGKGPNPLAAFNDEAFDRAVAVVRYHLISRLDAQLEDFFGD